VNFKISLMEFCHLGLGIQFAYDNDDQIDSLENNSYSLFREFFFDDVLRFLHFPMT
jgi:hypothetical protein